MKTAGLLPRDADAECGKVTREQMKPSTVCVPQTLGRLTLLAVLGRVHLTQCTLEEEAPLFPWLCVSAFGIKMTSVLIVGLTSFISRITVYILV